MALLLFGAQLLTSSSSSYFMHLTLYGLSLLLATAAAMELPADFMREGAALLKSAEYAASRHHMQYPVVADVNAAEVVELPPHVSEADAVANALLENLNASENDEAEMQHEQPQQDQHKNTNNNNINNMKAFIKLQQQQQLLRKPHKHHASTLRHCSIEITSKIPGICQPMTPIGSACVSGDYMDVFNLECM